MDSTGLTSPPGSNGTALPKDLFALTDEQILEIEPEAQDVRVSGFVLTNPELNDVTGPAPVAQAEAGNGSAASSEQTASTTPRQTASPQTATATSPAPFSGTEDLKTLGELYPGGLSQAKAAAERARTLDEIDAAYFGAANGTPEQVSASRVQLAERMFHEDPSAFREMVFAGLRALEQASLGAPAATPSSVVAQHAAPLQEDGSTDASGETRAAYAAFERAANGELERSVGGAIDRTIAQALPNLSREEGASSAGARNGSMPLSERLASSVRQDVESALKSDRQLSEQIAQILAARRFDDGTRAQVVRLINDRAQQLVPGAARRVIGEWTSATLAAHGAKSERAAAASSRREVAPAAASSGPASSATPSRREIPRSADSARNDRARPPRGIDYRGLSDEQILDL